MMMVPRWLRWLLSALCALLISAAGAQTAAPDRVQEVNGITFVSGGIGADSRESLAAREKSYNFKLVLTLEGSGTFVCGR
jgi:hypothetical protein